MDVRWGFPKIPDENSLPTENLRNWKDVSGEAYPLSQSNLILNNG